MRQVELEEPREALADPPRDGTLEPAAVDVQLAQVRERAQHVAHGVEGSLDGEVGEVNVGHQAVSPGASRLGDARGSHRGAILPVGDDPARDVVPCAPVVVRARARRSHRRDRTYPPRDTSTCPKGPDRPPRLELNLERE